MSEKQTPFETSRVEMGDDHLWEQALKELIYHG